MGQDQQLPAAFAGVCLQLSGMELLETTHACSPGQPWHSQLCLDTRLTLSSTCQVWAAPWLFRGIGLVTQGEPDAEVQDQCWSTGFI